MLAVNRWGPCGAALRPQPQAKLIFRRRMVSQKIKASAVLSPSLELTAGCKAVRLASKLCQVVQEQLKDTEKRDKDDSSPVTVADYGAQAIVGWSLSRSVGPISLIAEEDSAELREPEGKAMLSRIRSLINDVIIEEDSSASLLSDDDVLQLIDMGNSNGGGKGSYWVLDPIDGTRGFVGMRQYAVCLGLIKDGEVVQGVLGCPNLPQSKVTREDGQAGVLSRASKTNIGCLFIGVQNQGAFAGDLWNDELPTKVIKVKDAMGMNEVQFMESYDARHSNHELTSRLAEKLGVTLPPIRMDSQVKYGALSRGDASLFMRFPHPEYREKIWDHCAGFAIVREAGGKVTDASGAPLDFSKGRWLDLDRGIIAGSPEVHEQVLQVLNE